MVGSLISEWGLISDLSHGGSERECGPAILIVGPRIAEEKRDFVAMGTSQAFNRKEKGADQPKSLLGAAAAAYGTLGYNRHATTSI
jgi:hypothetical protein